MTHVHNSNYKLESKEAKKQYRQVFKLNLIC